MDSKKMLFSVFWRHKRFRIMWLSLNASRHSLNFGRPGTSFSSDWLETLSSQLNSVSTFFSIFSQKTNAVLPSNISIDYLTNIGFTILFKSPQFFNVALRVAVKNLNFSSLPYFSHGFSREAESSRSSTRLYIAGTGARRFISKT